MPELPEVESVVRSLRRHVLQRRIVALDVPQPRLRWPVDPAQLRGATCHRPVLGVRRRAKYVLIELGAPGATAASAAGWAADVVLAVHLGMSGWLGVCPGASPRRLHDHAIFTLDDGRELRFNDARRFGSLLALPPAELLAHPRFAILGPEPLDAAAFDGPHLHRAARGSGRSVKALIMDASVVVGVGNIYACEALWRARIRPGLRASALSAPRATALAQAIVATLEDAIANGGTTLRDFSDADAVAGGYGERLQVYGRERLPCLACGAQVRRRAHGGRSTFYCPTCQAR